MNLVFISFVELEKKKKKKKQKKKAKKKKKKKRENKKPKNQKKKTNKKTKEKQKQKKILFNETEGRQFLAIKLGCKIRRVLSSPSLNCTIKGKVNPIVLSVCFDTSSSESPFWEKVNLEKEIMN